MDEFSVRRAFRLRAICPSGALSCVLALFHMFRVDLLSPANIDTADSQRSTIVRPAIYDVVVPNRGRRSPFYAGNADHGMNIGRMLDESTSDAAARSPRRFTHQTR